MFAQMAIRFGLIILSFIVVAGLGIGAVKFFIYFFMEGVKPNEDTVEEISDEIKALILDLKEKKELLENKKKTLTIKSEIVTIDEEIERINLEIDELTKTNQGD